MPDIPFTPETTIFLIRLFQTTKQGLIPWELTADPKILTAPLEADYSLRLEEVPDFEGMSKEPDHVLSLYKGRSLVFQIDRRDIPKEEVVKALGGEYQHTYTIFAELWRLAYLKAHRISEELETVNKFLERKLQGV